MNALIGELSSAEQQMVQIVRALLIKPRVLVFDEPSVALVQREVERLLRIVQRLRDDGLAIVYISHYLQEIEALCDRVTVLRNGRDVAEVSPRNTSLEQITRLMVNREVGELYPKVAVPAGALLLDVRGLGRARAYQGIDLQVRRGEIVGLTGLVGSGAKELLRSLFGLAPPDSGEVRLDGQPLSLRSPREAVAQGVALMPEERRRQGVALDLSVQENTTLAALSRFVRLGLLSAGARAAYHPGADRAPEDQGPWRACQGASAQRRQSAKGGAGQVVRAVFQPVPAGRAQRWHRCWRQGGDLSADR